MLEYLFGSKTRVRLLRLFFGEPEKMYFVRELTRILDVQINAIRRELELLQEAGIVEEVKAVDIVENDSQSIKKYYRLSQGSLIFPELQALLYKEKLLNEHNFIEELKAKAPGMKMLILSGHFTGDEKAPTDMLIVGDVRESIITKLIEQYEHDHRVIFRYTFMKEQEFLDRRHIMDKFLFTLFESKIIKAVDALQR
jgi:DNA-binding transcriptional ArsR family regulator